MIDEGPHPVQQRFFRVQYTSSNRGTFTCSGSLLREIGMRTQAYEFSAAEGLPNSLLLNLRKTLMF